ncbi:hypothetical protein Ddc_18067 [Ditylenchus destructor]|nr:hypothetical protein Ddc_18067 [Ditylenchus destructor]
MDIFLDVIPMILNFTFTMIAGFSITIYISQLVLFLVYLNVVVCSVYYSWRLTRQTNGLWTKICPAKSVQQVTPATTVM